MWPLHLPAPMCRRSHRHTGRCLPHARPDDNPGTNTPARLGYHNPTIGPTATAEGFRVIPANNLSGFAAPRRKTPKKTRQGVLMSPPVSRTYDTGTDRTELNRG
jgi:hypothetical protein